MWFSAVSYFLKPNFLYSSMAWFWWRTCKYMGMHFSWDFLTMLSNIFEPMPLPWNSGRITSSWRTRRSGCVSVYTYPQGVPSHVITWDASEFQLSWKKVILIVLVPGSKLSDNNISVSGMMRFSSEVGVFFCSFSCFNLKLLSLLVIRIGVFMFWFHTSISKQLMNPSIFFPQRKLFYHFVHQANSLLECAFEERETWDGKWDTS